MKSSFTRLYNKSSCPLPYATATMSKKKRKRQNATEDEAVVGVNDDGEFANDDGKFAANDSEQSDDDDIAADSMIKVRLLDHHSLFIVDTWYGSCMFPFQLHWKARVHVSWYDAVTKHDRQQCKNYVREFIG